MSPEVLAARATGCGRRAAANFGYRAMAAPSAPPPKANFPGRQSPRPRYDFAYGRSDIEVFPFEMWRRMLLRHARKASVRALDYGPTGGSVALREAICMHLRRSRAVLCEPSQVIVVSGSQQALDLVARVLIDRGDRIAIEDPCYQGTREVLRAGGARLLAVPVDRDGLNPAKLPDGTRMVFVTPSHQFPTGAILSLPRRLSLVDWARRTDALVVEDDYDGEYRYEDQSLQSLQGLDAEGRVIYIGTFSRTVFSSLRIGYLIVPKPLDRRVHLGQMVVRSPHRDARARDLGGVHHQRPVRAASAPCSPQKRRAPRGAA